MPNLKAALERPWLQIVLRLLVAGAFTALLYRLFGAFGIVFGAPLFGVLLARPLIDLAGDLKHGVRGLALDDVQGSFYAFKGRHIHVIEDEDHERWLQAADVRRVVPGLPADASLLNLAPQGSRRLGRRTRVYLSAPALLLVLARASEPATLRFKLWIERELVGPAARRREREGSAAPRPAPPVDSAGQGMPAQPDPHDDERRDAAAR